PLRRGHSTVKLLSSCEYSARCEGNRNHAILRATDPRTPAGQPWILGFGSFLDLGSWILDLHLRSQPMIYPCPSLHSSSSLASLTRRHFFSRCVIGLGSVALASLLNDRSAFGSAPGPLGNPMAPKQPHFRPRAKNIIFLFMAGGPSQLELFDYKSKLVELNGQPIPQSYIEGKRFAFMGSSHGTKLLGTRRAFKQYGQSGMWVSELFPHTATIVDDATFVMSCAADLFNHAPAKLFMNTGSGQFGRPSMGAWVTYGIGSESENLP